MWACLTDLEGWRRWNTLAASAPDGLVEGGRLRLRIHLPRGGSIPATARLIAVRPERELRWQGGVPGLFHAVHGFALEPVDGGTAVTHDERFRGLLVRPVLWGLGEAHAGQYERVNEGLARQI